MQRFSRPQPTSLPRFLSIIWQTLTDEIEFTEGMEIERGFISPYFVKNQEAVSSVAIHPEHNSAFQSLNRYGPKTEILPGSPSQQTCEQEAPRILVTDRKINNMNELVRACFSQSLT